MSKAFVRSIAAGLFIITMLTACGQKKMPQRLDGMYSSNGGEAVSDTVNSTAQSDSSESYAAPQFKSGSYSMTSSSIREQYAYSGKDIASAVKITQTYKYQIKLTTQKNDSMKAVYTFKRIQTSFEGSTTEAIDTNNKSGRTSDNGAYYDLIGKSFAVSISADYRLSISGIDKIIDQYPDAAYIINNDNMLEIASDLFYNIPDRLQADSSWQLTQSGVANTYSLSSVNKDKLVVDISGGQLAVPQPYTTDGGAVYTYQKCSPIKGSLVIDRSNRMLQEQSSYQENSGTIDFNGQSLTFTDSINSICSISKSN